MAEGRVTRFYECLFEIVSQREAFVSDPDAYLADDSRLCGLDVTVEEKALILSMDPEAIRQAIISEGIRKECEVVVLAILTR